MTDAVVWLVLWFVFMVFSFYGGLISLVHGSLVAGWFGKKRLIALTVPLGLALLAFSVFSLIQTILQIIDIITRVMA